MITHTLHIFQTTTVRIEIQGADINFHIDLYILINFVFQLKNTNRDGCQVCRQSGRGPY